MDEPRDSQLACDTCGKGVTDDDAFCPGCGSLFTDLYVCSRHPSVAAKGVCVICSQPFCDDCGKITNGSSLCDTHARYIIHEGMVRVFGGQGTLESQLAANTLSQAGLHPFSIADLEVYVPLSEIARAENVLNEIGLVTK